MSDTREVRAAAWAQASRALHEVEPPFIEDSKCIEDIERIHRPVAVHRDDDLSGCGRQPLFESATLALRRLLDDHDVRAEPGGDVDGAVGRLLVDDDDLIHCAWNGRQDPPESSLFVETWDDERDLGTARASFEKGLRWCHVLLLETSRVSLSVAHPAVVSEKPTMIETARPILRVTIDPRTPVERYFTT